MFLLVCYNCLVDNLTPSALESAVLRACLLEVTAEKPGNVTPTRAFHDTSYADFVRSAEAIAPVLGQAGALPVGALTLAAVRATQAAVGRNTNLGIVLLLAPLARAAALRGSALRETLRAVLAALTLDDARQVYAAIRMAAPGGLGADVEHDVRAEAVAPLLTAMASAATRDSIAREYVTDFEITFTITAPALADAAQRGLAPADAVVDAYLHLLAAVPDTLIARKRGGDDARWVSAQAQRIIALGGAATDAGRDATQRLDAALRDQRNTWNPGTSADLLAAGLFVTLLGD